MEYQAEIRVTPRAGILDPQGKAVGGALVSLGFAAVSGVHVGRLIRFSLQADSMESARVQLEAMCRRLLANPVIEDFDIRVEEVPGAER